MRLKLLTRLSSLLFVLILSLLTGCGASSSNPGQAEGGMKAQGREVALGETFKLIPDEKVRVKDTTLAVQLKSVRRTWYVDGKSETADADLIITLDNKEQRQWVGMGKNVTVGDYVVELRGANPFGKTDCSLVVTRR